MSLDVREPKTTNGSAAMQQLEQTAPYNPYPERGASASIRQDRRLAIQVEDLRRIYKIKPDKKAKAKGSKEDQKTLVALDNVSLEVYEGELFGLLGPNGAGKTTLIKILTTLLAPSGGTARVAGLDVVKQSDDVRRIINMVSGGETSGYGILKVHENLWMFSQFYGVTWKDANERIDELLKVVELEDKRNALVSSLSTGQRQRMNFCRGFVTDPTVMFLDEPTLGLDVHAARLVREFTRDWLKKHPDRTLLLTTHYMAEADELCDRIAIIDKGKVLACDTPANLKRMLQKQPVFEITASGINEATIGALGRAPGVVRVSGDPDESGSTYKLKFILEDESAIGSVVSELTRHNSSIKNLQKNEPTLEDVFIKLVGRSLTAEEDGKE
ncbi:MAG TPA: ABC transporter ATP-binding protein [Chloroflexia bacterium]|nr:ABC transporter ATP-binding protein [Chloroflexia bacterium]